MKDRIGIVVAARMGSRRLPGKALLPLGNFPMILFLLKRLSTSRYFKNTVFATTLLTEDAYLSSLVESNNIPVFRGSSEDVAHRYNTVSDLHVFDYIVRVTGDCPFVDGHTLDYFIDSTLDMDSNNFDIATTKGRFPVGIDFEIYNCSILKDLYNHNKLNNDDREHLTKFFYDHENLFNIRRVDPPSDWNTTNCKYTVDTEDDYQFANSLVKYFSQVDFSVKDLIVASEQFQPEFRCV